ncbi:hypothetical protein [Clostridium sp. UBA871]|uniref:hypothetical protein n=1 Tax=Clostridium sp. UBA871 TaxID=1946380 RepID=UPI003216B09F
MNKEKIEQIFNLFEDISLSEWKKLRDCIDREYNSQVNTLKFKKRDTFKKDLETEFIQ